MLSLSCAQIPECKYELSLRQELLCKAFVIYVTGIHSVYVPINPKASIRKAKKTGYEIVEVSWRNIEASALGLTLLLANNTFPEELVEFVCLPNSIEHIDETELIEEWKDKICP
jgi:hypothetical protein